MPTGVRAELAIQGPYVCQVAPVSEDTASVVSVSWGLTDSEGTVTEEFTARGKGHAQVASPGSDLTPLFSSGERTTYRFERDKGQGCVCERVERTGCTVRRVRAADGGLILTLLAPGVGALREVVTDLEAAYDDVCVRRFIQSNGDGHEGDLLFFDAHSLTDRQLEVVETAHEMGYFAYPRESNAAEIAESLDITTPTFTEHLATAQRKFLDQLFD